MTHGEELWRKDPARAKDTSRQWSSAIKAGAKLPWSRKAGAQNGAGEAAQAIQAVTETACAAVGR